MNFYLLFFVVSVIVFWYINRESKIEIILAEENDNYEFCKGYLYKGDLKMPESCLNQNFESEQCRLEFRELNSEVIASKACFLKCMNNSIAY